VGAANQPPAPSTVHIRNVLTSRGQDEVGITIMKEQFITLCEGDTSDLKSKRNTFGELFSTALFGFVGLLATGFDVTSQHQTKWPYWFIVPSGVAVAVFGTAWIIYAIQAREKNHNSPFVRTKQKCEAAFVEIERQQKASQRQQTASERL
jgi:hypothetical protein